MARRRRRRRRRNPSTARAANPSRRRRRRRRGRGRSLGGGHHGRRRRRRRNPSFLGQAWHYAKPVALAVAAGGAGILGSFALSRVQFQSKAAFVAANGAAAVVTGVAVGMLDPFAGMLVALPFVKDALEAMLSPLFAKLSNPPGATTAQTQPAPQTAGLAGLDDAILQARQMQGVTTDDLGAIETPELAGIEVTDIGALAQSVDEDLAAIEAIYG